MRIFYHKTGKYLKSFAFDDDLSDAQENQIISSDYVEVPREVLRAYPRDVIEEYMETYDPQSPTPVPSPKSSLWRYGEEIDKALAEYFEDEDWSVKTGGTDTGAQIEAKLDSHFGSTVWKQGGSSQNNAPSFVSSSHTVVQGEDLVVTLAATDTDSDPLTFTVTGSSDFSQNGNVITFNSAVVGQQTLNVTVDDGNGGTDTGTVTITVTQAPTNNPPVLSDQNITVVVDTFKTITVGPAIDQDGHSVTYTITGSSDFTQSDNRITFSSSTLGQQTLSVTGDDGNGETASATITIDVVNETTETYPVIASIPEQFVATDGTLTLSVSLTNPTTAGAVQWYKDFGHDDIQVNPTTGAITWDTTGLAGESFHVGLRCSNDNGVGRRTFIVHVGKVQGDVLYVGPLETYTTWMDAEAAHKAGDTIIFRDGTYLGTDNRIGRDNSNSSDQYPKSGTSAKLTCVMAENPLMAIFDGGDAGVAFNLWSGGKNESSYITFKGLFVQGGSTLAINGDPNDKANTRPHHIKVINCGGVGEDDIPLYSRLCDYVIFENCFAYGGGRYKISINESTKCIFRRNVARYDRSDRKPAEDPKGSHIMYNTMDFRMDNCIAIDDVDRFVNNGYKAGAFGTPVTATSVTPEGSRGIVERCLHLNSEQLLSQFDYQVSNGGGASDVESYDVVSFDSKPHDIAIYTWGFNLWQKCTFSKIRPLHQTQDSLINAGGYNNFRGLVNCIWDDTDPLDTGIAYGATNITVGDVGVPYNGGTSRTVTKYGMSGVNLTNSGDFALIKTGYGTQHESGTTTTAIDADFKYVTRLEKSNALADTHAGEVMYLKGKSGTFWGDPGYDEDTEIPMWDFPFEHYIREKMESYSWSGPEYSGSDYLNRVQGANGTLSGARGFCAAGETLTSYVWGYKGSTVPPMGLVGINGDAQATIRWELPADNHQTNITGYTVYDYNPTTGAMTNGRAVAAGTREITISSLINGFDHWFAVTATDSVTGESSLSYPVYIRPNGTPTVLPQIDTHPQGVSVIDGDQVTFTASIQGYNSLQWKKDGVDIVGATGLSYTFTAATADDGAVYTIVATNDVGDQASNGASLSVKPLDSTAPTVSISVASDTLNITASDNIYTAAELTLQLLDGGSPVGSTFSGSITSLDLTAQSLPNGTRTLTVSATDPQNNTGTSNSESYLVGSPVFTDDFTDSSNWSGSLATASNEGTVNGTIRGTTDWWSSDTKGSVKFEMKVMDQANDYEADPRFKSGSDTSGTSLGTIEIFCYPQTFSNSWADYVDRSGTRHSLGSFNGFGNPSGDTGGTEAWIEYEVSLVGTAFAFLANGVELTSATLPEDIGPFSGTMQIQPLAAGDLMIRNVTAYA